MGAITAAVGANTITTGNGGIGSSGFVNGVLTIASLSRSAGTTVNFTSNSGALGAPGNNASILFSSPLSTVGKGVLGAWAIANTSDYAAYNSTNGVGVVGAGGFAAYDAGFGTGNITNLGGTSLTAVTTNLSAGTTTTSLLRFQGGFTNDLTFTNAADVLHLELGGILRSNNNNPTTIGTSATRGVITSGLGELVVYHNQNTLTINSVIQGVTALVKSGSGTLALSAPNTYTLGTVVNQGTVTLNAPGTGGIADHVVIPNGGLLLAGATVTMVTNSGQIGSSNSVTLNGSSTLTMVGNNSLVGLTFNNTGGTTNPSVASGGILTLTSATPLTVTTNNPTTTPTVSGTVFLAAGGANTISVGAITHDGTAGGTLLVDSLPSLNVSATLTGPDGTSLVKSGNGLLQLSGANTFNGGVSVTAGGIVLGSNSVGLDSGPLGTGSAVFANGTTLFVDNNSRTLANALNFVGNPTFSNTGTTLRTLTLNGELDFDTLTTTGLVIDLPTPWLDLILGGELVNAASITSIGTGSGANSITKTGLGNITGINLTGVNPAVTINVAGLNTSATAFSLLLDGDGTVRNETINVGSIVTTGTPSLIIGRAGSTYLPHFTTALNKTIQPASLSMPDGVVLSNSNGYGLLVTDNTSLNATTAPVFNVATASASNVVQGLTLSGLISGGIASSGNVTLTKSGTGTLVLNNAGNTFGGSGAIIDITAGILEATSNGALGNTGNVVRISTNNATQGLRLSGGGSYTLTGRTIYLNNTSNGLDVTGGTTVTLDTAFGYATATNNLQKNDNGTLIINADNTGWSGTLTVNGGVLQLANANALGGGSLALTGIQGTAVQLTGGQSFSRPLNLNNSTSANIAVGGIDFGGQLDNFSGTNTWSGAITTSTDSSIGARSGTTLNLTGGISMATSTGRALFFNAVGDININTTALTNGAATSWHRIEKYGAGTLNITTANTGLTFTGSANGAAVSILGGDLKLSGAGAFNTAAWTTNSIFIANKGSLTLDNTGTNVNQRTTSNTVASARALNMSNGTLNFMVNGAASSAETFGALTSTWGGNKIKVTTTGQSSTLVFASLANAINGSSTLVFESAGTGANFGTAANTVTFTTAPTLTNGILARGVVVDGATGGVNFATYGSSLTAYTAYNNSGAYTNLNTAAAIDNVKGWLWLCNY